jgi:exonuclease III
LSPGWLCRLLPLRREEGLQRRRHLRAAAPDRIVEGFGNAEFDAEGRYLQADFGKLSVVSLYLPSGSSSDERQQAKFRFLDQFRPQLERLAQEAKRKGARSCCAATGTSPTRRRT